MQSPLRLPSHESARLRLLVTQPGAAPDSQKHRADLQPVGALALPPEGTQGSAAGLTPQGLLLVLTGLLEPIGVSSALCLCSKEGKSFPSPSLPSIWRAADEGGVPKEPQRGQMRQEECSR